MDILLLGGGWVTAANYGRMREGTPAIICAGDPRVPPAEEVYSNLPIRYRRFDDYCRAGCAAIALALQDAGLDRGQNPRPIGVIASTRYGCFETDVEFWATAAKAEGLFASPSLFAYTLPGIAISEAAVHFRLSGPTFTVGDPAGQRGYRALGVGVDLLSCGTCRTVLAGWLDAGTRWLKHPVAGDDGVRGAIFLVLSLEPQGKGPIRIIRETKGELFTERGLRVSAISDLVA
jgi:3-oxoacyl-(acyl-carrier-protein) synthase